MRKITQALQHRVVVEVNNRAAVNRFRLFVHPDFMQGKWRKEKQASGAHGVVTVIDNRDAKPFFHIENFKTLMPVVVTHRVSKQAAERRYGVV